MALVALENILFTVPPTTFTLVGNRAIDRIYVSLSLLSLYLSRKFLIYNKHRRNILVTGVIYVRTNKVCFANENAICVTYVIDILVARESKRDYRKQKEKKKG